MTAQMSIQQSLGLLRFYRRVRLPRLSHFFVPGNGVAGKSIICGLFLLGTSLTAQAVNLIVINTADSGAGSLRQAILDSNGGAGVPDAILFDIPGPGVHTIIPLTALPTITRSVLIQGYTQPGSSANTLAVGDNSVHLIELNGNGANFAGLTITAGNSVVNGLVINRFNGNGPANGITIQTAGGNLITGCFIGLDPTGTIDLSNSRIGIDVESAGNTIGGTTPQARNVIFGPPYAIYAPAGNAGGNTIQGNYIGTNAPGNAGLIDVSNAGVFLETANNIVGGSVPGAGNVLSGGGLETRGDGTVIQGNYVGISADGTATLSNGYFGITIVRASNNLIGGTTGAARNVVACLGNRITIIGPATGNTIQGNYVGTNAAGTLALPAAGSAGFGVEIEEATNTLVGGTVAGARNVIANSLQGLRIFNSPSGNNLVQGNYIGTNAAGTAALPNSSGGVVIFTSGGPPSSNNIIGGTAPGAGNVISGNNGAGVSVAGAFSSNNSIQGNFVGVASDGVTALGNHGNGIEITANVTGNNNIIGGTTAGAGNVIAHNGQTGSLNAGVRIESGTGNSILGNSIFSNRVLGINLASNDNVTPNDPCDVDTGPNNLQNYPVITSVSSSGGMTSIVGTLNSVANTAYRLEFFANNSVNSSGFGEGQNFVGTTNVTTDASCNASFTINVPQIAGNQRVTATATDPNGNTSEFSAAIGQLLNISSRLRVQTGENVLIGGFIITGTEPKRVIARGIGPSLSGTVQGSLADPTAELHGPSGFVTITNDNWRDMQEAEIMATGIAPTNDLESAIVGTLPAGSAGYTVVLRGKDNTTGVGVVEAYDLDTAANSKLANISTRGLVETGNDVLIGGFITGNGVTKVIVRAIGPSLLGSGVTGVLLDPTLELHDSSGAAIATNDDWKVNDTGGSQQAEIEATTIPPTDDRESALVRTLVPGNYTAVVRGKNNTTGIAVVEVYNIP